MPPGARFPRRGAQIGPTRVARVVPRLPSRGQRLGMPGSPRRAQQPGEGRFSWKSVHFMHGAGFGHTGRTSRFNAHLLRIDVTHALVVGSTHSGAKRVVKRPKVRGGQEGTEAAISANGPFRSEIAAFRSWRRFLMHRGDLVTLWKFYEKWEGRCMRPMRPTPARSSQNAKKT